MCETENKYQRSKIYKLVSDRINDIYYGSTIEPYLANRLSGHRQCFRRWMNGKGTYISSYEIVKFDDCKIILVERFPCNTKDELRSREQYYIDNNECINKQKAYTGLSKKEYEKQYYENNKEKIVENKKEYRENNKEKIQQQQKEYYENNKEKFTLYKNIYYNNNKTDILQKAKEYYVDNKEKYINRQKTKIICDCGGRYTLQNKTNHINTHLHQDYLKILENDSGN